MFDAGLVLDKPSPPSVSFQSMGVRFTALRREPPWLQRLPYAPVRYVLKYQAEAWKRAFAGGGFPRFKARRGDDSFTIPQDVRVRDGVLSVPKVGRIKLSRRGGNPHAGCPPVKATVKRVNGNWYCVIVYKVSAVARPDNGLALGVDMKTKAMTRSARGSAEHPGRNVGQKAGLNREILNTGWSQLRRMLEYKAAHVEVVPPMYTSQTCRRCGRVDPASRRSQSEFECVHCGHKGNADVNAALNIMASATGAAGRRGALALATPTNRQHVYRRRAA